ncbi:hypothetical protein GCM10009582_06660 [Arthrobacter flavus]
MVLGTAVGIALMIVGLALFAVSVPGYLEGSYDLELARIAGIVMVPGIIIGLACMMFMIPKR